MPGFKSPVEDAYHQAVSNRLLSMVYSALNGGVPPEERRRFRKVWLEEGSYRLSEVLLNCSRPEWTSYPDTFWIDPWIAEHLLAHCGGPPSPDPGFLCYFVDRWLENEPLPNLVSDDPFVEEEKVRELKKLFAALNR
jgi:hypothetical protein